MSTSAHEDAQGVTPAEHAADLGDLENARVDAPNGSIEQRKPFWKCLGPGLITGVADDDPSGIGTYSVTGAQFGYGLLWLTPVCIPLMIAVQEMCGRIGIVTGSGLASVIKRHYPKWLLYGAVLLLIGANVFNIYADLNVMAASAQMLFGGAFAFWLALFAGVTVIAQIFVPYHLYVRILRWLCLALLAYVITALLPSVKNDWGQIARNFFIPSWSQDPAFIMTVVGYAMNFVQVIIPVKALFYSAVLNGVVAVPLLIVLMLICNNRKIVKSRLNGRVSNILGWLTVVIMAAAVALMFWAMWKGPGQSTS